MPTESVYCLECDHEHECRMVYGQYEGDDYLDVPDCCEGCGESLNDGIPSDASLRDSERKQMGLS